MADSDTSAFVRANLPPPPCAVLEVGAGEGELAAALRGAGYAVTAIDPQPRGDDVQAVAVGDLEASAGTFAAAVAMRSLHHVHPLEPSLRRLAEVLGPGAPLVIDEMDVAVMDRRIAEWWLAQQAAVGTPREKTPDQLVEQHRGHLHDLATILAALAGWFTFGTPIRGPWLYRWELGEAFRAEEESLIAAGKLPAMGARIIAIRRG